MNIIEAIKKAKEIDGYITRPSYCKNLFIKPTNHCASCMLITPDRQTTHVGRGWQPQECDFLAEDWEVVSKSEYIAMVDWIRMGENTQFVEAKAKRELHNERTAKRTWIICSVIMFVALITQLVLK